MFSHLRVKMSIKLYANYDLNNLDNVIDISVLQII